MARKSALILSAIAVFMSLGGVSYAVGKGTIGSKAVKDNSLRGKDVRTNTLRGSDILESSLGIVPSAKSAQTANTAESAQKANSVDGMNLAKLNFAAPTTTATIVIVGFRAPFEAALLEPVAYALASISKT